MAKSVCKAGMSMQRVLDDLEPKWLRNVEYVVLLLMCFSSPHSGCQRNAHIWYLKRFFMFLN